MCKADQTKVEFLNIIKIPNMNINFYELYLSIAGSAYGFLYLLSDSYLDNRTKQQLIKALFIAFRGAVASVPLGGLGYELIINTHLLSDKMEYSPFLRSTVSFLVCVKHLQVLDFFMYKIFKIRKKNKIE